MVINSENILDAVTTFAAQETGWDRAKLTADTTLVEMGLDGDDAEEFIRRFGESFSVDLSEFNFSDHFGSEGLPPYFLFSWIIAGIRRLSRDSWEEAIGKQPIAITDLVNAVNRRKW